MGSPYGDAVAEGGILLTKTLLISYLSKRGEVGRSANGSYLRAFDKATGEPLGEVDVGVRLHGAPMTYMHAGRQYIAVAGGGRRGDDELVAFALPQGALARLAGRGAQERRVR